MPSDGKKCPKCGGETESVFDHYNTYCPKCHETPDGCDTYEYCPMCKYEKLVHQKQPGPCNCGHEENV